MGFLNFFFKKRHLTLTGKVILLNLESKVILDGSVPNIRAVAKAIA
jgi:archaellum biogenesis ATPase FlaH